MLLYQNSGLTEEKPSCSAQRWKTKKLRLSFRDAAVRPPLPGTCTSKHHSPSAVDATPSASVALDLPGQKLRSRTSQRVLPPPGGGRACPLPEAQTHVSAPSSFHPEEPLITDLLQGPAVRPHKWAALRWHQRGRMLVVM